MSATDPRTDALRKLETWDMLELKPDGHGAHNDDAPWARALIANALARADAVDTRVQQLTDWVDVQIAGLQRSSMTETTRGALIAFMRVKEKLLAQVDASPKEDA